MRILVVQLKRLGDLVLTTPVFAALREALPEARITLAAPAAAADLAPLLDVDEILLFGNGRADWLRLLRGKFDVCLDFTGNDRSLLVSALSRARMRITYQRFAAKPFRRFVFTRFVDSNVSRRHTADHHVDLLQPLGIHRERVPSHLRAGPLPAGIAKPYAILHAGTARREKYWSAEGWAGVGRMLA
ncbi:MAG TPA: hypothetical protein VIS74_01585, partial [Chthoniobacterales bacterium]